MSTEKVMQQDLNLPLPALESKENSIVTQWLQVGGDRAKAGRERKSTLLPGRVNASNHLWRGQKTSGKRNLLGRKACCTHCSDRKSRARAGIQDIAHCCCFVLGSAEGWGFWGQRLGRKKGCWEHRVTLSEDTLATRERRPDWMVP